MGKKIIIANWKMNPPSLREAEALVSGYRKHRAIFKQADIIVCPPFVFGGAIAKRIKAYGAGLGAQNVGSVEGGTHTGEVSAAMLKSIGVTHVIIGHSERRAMGESDDVVNQKVTQVLKAGLYAIVAVGESEKSEDAHMILDMQVQAAFRGVSGVKAKRVIIAYEPRWAISKGPHDTSALSDTPEHAIEKMIYIRKVIARLYGPALAKRVPILYGGSVRSANAGQFTKRAYGFDGVLVGGASLNPREFAILAQAVINA